MNTDERFNYYSDRMTKVAGEKEAKRLETAMSQMLELHCDERLIWQYAERQIKTAKGGKQS